MLNVKINNYRNQKTLFLSSKLLYEQIVLNDSLACNLLEGKAQSVMSALPSESLARQLKAEHSDLWDWAVRGTHAPREHSTPRQI